MAEASLAHGPGFATSLLKSPNPAAAQPASAEEPRTPDNAPRTEPDDPAVPKGRQYCRWSRAEEDIFVSVLRSHAGCDACVVYANAAKRISSKNYVQCRHYYNRLLKRTNALLVPSQQIEPQNLKVMHRAMLIYWNHLASRMGPEEQSCSGLKGFSRKPRKVKEFETAVQQGVARMASQSDKLRPPPKGKAMQQPCEPDAASDSGSPASAMCSQAGAELAGGGAGIAQPIYAPSACAKPAADSPAGAAAAHQPAEAQAALATRITVQLLPGNSSAQQRVESARANPFLELANVKSNKSVQFLAEHLQKKWGAAKLPQLRAVAGGHVGGPTATPATLAGQLFVAAGSPAALQLHYFWADAAAAAPWPAAAQQPQTATGAGLCSTAQPAPQPAQVLAQQQQGPATAAAGQQQCRAAAHAAAPKAKLYPMPKLRQAATPLQAVQPASAPRAATATVKRQADCAALKQTPRAKRATLPKPVAPASGASVAPAVLPPTQQAASTQLGNRQQTRQHAAGAGSGGPAVAQPVSRAPPAAQPVTSQGMPPPGQRQQQLSDSEHGPLRLFGTQLGDQPQPPAASTPGTEASSLLSAFGLTDTTHAGAAEHSLLASLPSGPRVNEFGLEESCDAFSARWCSGAGPAASAGAGAGKASQRGGEAAGQHSPLPASSPQPLRLFDGLPGMEPPDRQAAAANTDMAHILEHLCSEDGLSNMALPASLFGDFSLAASGLHASPLRGMQSPLGAFRSPPGRSRMGKMTASVGSPAPSFGGSLLGRFGAAATESPSKLPMTAFGNAGDGFSQLEMDVGSLLGLGAGGEDPSWDAPPNTKDCTASAVSAPAPDGGLKPFHELFPTQQPRHTGRLLN